MFVVFHVGCGFEQIGLGGTMGDATIGLCRLWKFWSYFTSPSAAAIAAAPFEVDTDRLSV